MTENTKQVEKPDFGDRLRTIARHQRTLRKLRDLRNAAYEKYVKGFDDSLVDQEEIIAHEIEDVKTLGLNYVERTGDTKLHLGLSYVARGKLAYDPDKVLTQALIYDDDVVRRPAPELDMRAFEKAFKAGDATWADDLVTLKSERYVSISKDLEDLIGAETDD